MRRLKNKEFIRFTVTKMDQDRNIRCVTKTTTDSASTASTGSSGQDHQVDLKTSISSYSSESKLSLCCAVFWVPSSDLVGGE